MGQEIASTQFSEADHAAFRERLREETKQLKAWFDQRAFDYSDRLTIGLELEAWLVDGDALPAPENRAFLAAADDPDIVEELSRFNFEINAPPRPLYGDAFDLTRRDLEATWATCRRAAGSLGLTPVAVGILPTVRDEMLQPDWMSDTNRYRALNRELMLRRGGRPLHICIEGADTLDYRCDHIMLEAACTSLQAHLKVNQEEAVRLYNAAILAAAPLVAATANSPLLYGCSLWAETRIPAFEQATALEGFRDARGQNVRRVTLGTGYLRRSMLELFLENQGYPVLLPALADDSARMAHLRLQNGTVWRWVRPILGFDGSGTPHLRLEHRVMPAGPSVIDTLANLALCHGLVLALGRAGDPPELETPFAAAHANFYACARDGLAAAITWAGRQTNVQALLVDQLLPAARAALEREGVSDDDLTLLFDEVLAARLRTGRTGTDWQRSFIDCNGPSFQALTERYMALQAGGAPVHEWTV